MFNEEGYRVSSLRAHHYTCTEFGHSMHVTRKVGSTLQPMTSTADPTLTTRIKTGLKICTGPSLSMPSVVWPVANFVATTSIHTNAPPFVEE